MTNALTFLAILIGLAVPLNIWNYRRRAAMTPAERRAEDDDWETWIW